MANAIIPHVDVAAPLTVQQAVEQYNAQADFIRAVLKKDLDYGVIPGTGNKPTLYKAGAEKAINFYRYAQEFVLIEHVEDWTGAQHGGEPFFYYHYKARLLFGGLLVAEAEGSCNSWEEKYRYRKGERICPNCGKSAIIKGKQDYGGGWLCFGKKGGCGSKWPDGSEVIEAQNADRMPNDRIFDQVNTIKKMAQKRALVAVALIGCRLSDTFTQDIEDMVYEASYTIQEAHEHPKPSANGKKPPTLDGVRRRVYDLFQDANGKKGNPAVLLPVSLTAPDPETMSLDELLNFGADLANTIKALRTTEAVNA